MEQRLLSAVDGLKPTCPTPTEAALSLITNPFTLDPSIFSLLETLNHHLEDSNSNHRKILSLLAALSHHHPCLSNRISATATSFIRLPSTPINSVPKALALLDPAHSAADNPFFDESLFLSLCFLQCAKTRRWAIKNVSKFLVSPSVMLTVLLVFTKDPYPNIREAALDGLVVLGNVEDCKMVESCYFRAVELLFDADNAVRGAAVRAVSKWGQLLIALSPDAKRRNLSDALFVQLCLMVRDMDVEIRISALNAISHIQTVSEDILLQTLSKKALPAMKERSYPGQYTAKLFKLPAAAAAFAFIHGLEDEFFQVRTSACHALQILAVNSAKFSGGVVDRLVDMLNDDAVVVKLKSLEALRLIAVNGHLNVDESHLDMFSGALIDNSALIRSAARNTLQLTKLRKLMMFRSCINSLINNLERYPKDEAEIFNALYKIGQAHGKFVISTIRGVSQELEPSFDGKLSSNKAKRAALLALAISAPVSLEQQTCSIPPQIYSYAVMLLGRLSCGLVDVTDQNTLLAYLSCCSRFTVAPTSENLEGGLQCYLLKDRNVQLPIENDEISSSLPKPIEVKKVTAPLHDCLVNSHIKATHCLELVLRKVVDLWPLIKVGCMNEVVRTLRGWKEELKSFHCDSWQLSGAMIFSLKYLHIIKLLGRAWACFFFQRKRKFKGMEILETVLGKMEQRLKELLYRYTGVTGQEKLHILELMLLTFTLKLSYRGIFCFDEYMEKLKHVLQCVEHLQKEVSMELSGFVIEIQNISGETGNTNDGTIHKLHQIEKSLNLFALKHVEVTRELKYVDAEVNVRNNDFQNPFPFISGLPVGIPLDITLYSISRETRLWVTMILGEKSAQFVFLDLDEVEDDDDSRKFQFVVLFFRTPKVKHFCLKVSIAMECLSEHQQYSSLCNGPKHELIHLCKGKEVHLSTSVK